MYARRSQGDSKSTGSLSGSLSAMPTSNNAPSTATTGRVSIYSMRERVILNKMTRMIGKLAPNTETEVTSRLHLEIPAIRLDGHLTYCLYMTLQNLLHLSATYLLLYHTVFWLDPNNFDHDLTISSRILEQSKYEQTHFMTVPHDYYLTSGMSINIDLINKYVYISLLGVSFVELLSAFLWTLRKKLPQLIQRNHKLKHRFSRLLVAMIVVVYLSLVAWLLFHTFVTHQLTSLFCSLILGHLLIVTLLDKPYLFRRSSENVSEQAANTRKQPRNSTSSSSTSSVATSALGRSSHRSSASAPAKKPTSAVTPAPSVVKSWSRWSSVTEVKLEVHECSTFYGQARQEADDLWPLVVRRILLTLYRTFTSMILFDAIPLKLIGPHVRSIDSQPMKLIIFIFTLSTLITHSTFLFPVKLQTTLQRIATHLGQWRVQPNVRTETINEWSSECNSYTRGSVVRLPSTNRYFIAIQHLSNAAHPQSHAHAMLYRLFSDLTYPLTIQFILCIVLAVFHVIWIILGRTWEQTLISWFIIFYSAYPIFKITRDRVIMDFVEEHEYVQTTTTATTARQKKSS